MIRQHRVQCAPCELAVACFAATSEAKTAHFTDRIGREVIVQHEVIVGEPLQPVDHLLSVFGAQSGGADRLSFAAREQRRTMRAGQQANHGFDRANLIELAAIDTRAILDDRTANDFAFQLFDRFTRDQLRLRFFFGEGFFSLGPRRVDSVRAL